jgi:hypothetical protein
MKNNLFTDFAEGLELNLPADTPVEQYNTDIREWHRARLGRFTASRISKLMVSGRRKDELFGAGAMIAAERMLTPEGQDQYIDQLMSNDFKQTRWGTDHEAQARDMVGAVPVRGRSHPDYPMFGASPDGILTDGTLVEIKCPWTVEKHIANGRMSKPEDNEYYAQMQAQMAVFGADKCLFVSYDPRQVKSVYLQDVPRNDEYIADMLHRIIEAEKIINEINEVK